MSVEVAIESGLTGHAGLSALVGSRVYINKPPEESTVPLIVFNRISTVRHQAFGGVIKASEPRWQFDIYCDPDDATNNPDAVQAQLVDAIYSLPNAGGVTLGDRLLLDEEESFDEASGRLRRRLDAMIAHSGAS